MIALTATAALLGIGTPASAGGWAVSMLDDPPTEVRAGAAYDVTYTILQHGKTPVDVEDSAIVVTRAGETLRFEGESLGEPGRYRAVVAVPSDGAWQWRVDQGWFADHDLGTLTVLPAPTTSAPLPVLVAAAVVAAALVWRARGVMPPLRNRVPSTHAGWGRDAGEPSRRIARRSTG